MPHLLRRRNLTPALLILLSLLLSTLPLRAAAPASSSAPAKTQRLFWKVTTPTTTLYFLGSIHVADKSMYPLPKEIEAAYKDSANLVVEADVTKVDQNAMMNQLLTTGMYAPGDSLDKHLSPETMKKVAAFFESQGLPAAVYGQMKPPLVAMMIEASLTEKLGVTAEEGIDMHFLNAANKDKDKKIVELESADAQIKLLFSLDDKLTEKWVASSMEQGSKEELNKTIQSWKDGDVSALEKEMLDEDKKDPDSAKVTEILVYQRNDVMTKKIDDMLKASDKTFVVVGAAHLVGDRGILKQLQAKGYKVERPDLTAPPAAASNPSTAPAKP
jgi:hypothetical protein